MRWGMLGDPGRALPYVRAGWGSDQGPTSGGNGEVIKGFLAVQNVSHRAFLASPVSIKGAGTGVSQSESGQGSEHSLGTVSERRGLSKDLGLRI